MSIIKWSEELCIGIDGIDEQHRQLINLINELHLAVEYPMGNAAILPLIHKLHAYAGTHFEAEEQILRRHAFPGQAGHTGEHEEFIAKLDDLILRYQSSSDLLTVHIRDFLLSWFFNHIKNSDMAYKLFLEEKKRL